MRKETRSLRALLVVAGMVFLLAPALQAQQAEPQVQITVMGNAVTVRAPSDLVSDNTQRTAAMVLACMPDTIRGNELRLLSVATDSAKAVELRSLANRAYAGSACPGRALSAPSTTTVEAGQPQEMSLKLYSRTAFSQAQIGSIRREYAVLGCRRDARKLNAQFEAEDQFDRAKALYDWAERQQGAEECVLSSIKVQSNLAAEQCRVGKKGAQVVPCHPLLVSTQLAATPIRETTLTWTAVQPPPPVIVVQHGKPFWCFRSLTRGLVCVAAVAIVACGVSYFAGGICHPYKEEKQQTYGKTAGTPFGQPDVRAAPFLQVQQTSSGRRMNIGILIQ